MKRSAAIGAGGGRTRAQVPQPARGAVPSPRVRAIGGAVIRHYGLHRDPVGAEPRQRPVQEGQGVTLWRSLGRTSA